MDFKDIRLKELLNIKDDREALTHGGRFHADDVFAAALLKLIKPDIQIKRINTLPKMYDGLIFDIGFGEYDHHQKNKRVRANGIHFAAFGLLWEKLGAPMVGEKIAESFDRNFVEKIDYTDNSGKSNLISEAINDFNPSWNEDNNYDKCFEEAVSFAAGVLKRRIEKEIRNEAAKEEIHNLLKNNTDKCVVLDRPMPWKSVLVGTDTEFVIFPSARGGYMIQTVPISNEELTPVVEFPYEWYGADAETLRRISGVKTFTFCHSTGYIASAGSLEDARKIVNISKENATAKKCKSSMVLLQT